MQIRMLPSPNFQKAAAGCAKTGPAMPVTINAVDNEFAASSGANVNNTAHTSTFDYPPNSTSNLTITSNMGD